MTGNVVFLHIGIHKTGTSSIQATFAANRDTLLAHKIIYPTNLASNHSHFFYNAFARKPENYHVNRLQNLSRDEIHERTEADLQSLAREFAGQRDKTIVFSAEDACVLDGAEVANMAEVIKAVVPRPTFRVLVYTRNPVDYVASAVQENVKGNALTVARAKAIHIAGSRGRYQAIQEHYAGVFGADAIIMRAFETAIAGPGGLVGDVLSRMGAEGLALEQVRANEGIADEVVEFLSSLHQRGAFRQLPEADVASLLTLPGTKGSLLGAEEREEIWQRTETDRAFLKAEHGIAYEKPGDISAETQTIRQAIFREALARMLPTLSAQTQLEVTRFLAGVQDH